MCADTREPRPSSHHSGGSGAPGSPSLLPKAPSADLRRPADPPLPAWALSPRGTRPACTHPDAQQDQVLTVAESSLCVPTTLPGPTSAGGSEQTQSVVRHATSQGARGHTHAQQRPLLLRVWGNFLRVDEPERAAWGPPRGGPCHPGWWEGGHTRAANGTMTETPSWGQPLPVSSCQSLIRSPDSQRCWTSLPALTGSVRWDMGRDWLLVGQRLGTCGLEPHDLLSWGPGCSPQATSGRAEHRADLRKRKLSLSLPRKCQH